MKGWKVAAKPTTFYDDDTREDLLDTARSGGVNGYLARQKLGNDARRRERHEAAIARPIQFDVPALIRTNRGFDGRGGGRVAHVTAARLVKLPSNRPRFSPA